MPANVVRFGGNNIKNPEIIRSFVSILKNSPQNHLIVLSAAKDIQQILNTGLELLRLSTKDHTLISDQLIKISKEIQELYDLPDTKAFKKQLEPLTKLLLGIQFTGDYSLALRDQVLTFAELLTAALLEDILKKEGFEAKLFTTKNPPLIVSSEYGNASVLKQASTKNLKEFNWRKINLIPGSYGKTKEGKIARLGDHASDYSAAALADLLNAEKLELWEISKSFKTVDDSIVPNSTYISNLTYAEASELAYFNHSSIHPRIVEPLLEKHLPIFVYDLVDGEKVLRTKINSTTNGKTQTIKSVAHSDEIAILKLNGPGVGFKPGILGIITSAFANHRINIRSVITAQTSINIIINKEDAQLAEKLGKELNLPSVNEVKFVSNISLIAIVGHGMQTNYGISAQLFTAVARHKINVLLSGSGASDLVSYLIVDENDKTKAIQEIHKIFFNN